ncbi:hypothetical protein CEXT_444481 [Caerostris extrusa]|uniref:Uncharacterized protein n=1 Tax=Caerostris extrusa TaxID=172846 RepID=A0AAV4U3K8_CAEEX|nr:hypothetical protein CEXT_444481 [Caerostris extrusa]
MIPDPRVSPPTLPSNRSTSPRRKEPYMLSVDTKNVVVKKMFAKAIIAEQWRLQSFRSFAVFICIFNNRLTALYRVFPAFSLDRVTI